MSERLGTWVEGIGMKSGIPTEQYINLYDKFGYGGFGTILTGNIMVDIVSDLNNSDPDLVEEK